MEIVAQRVFSPVYIYLDIAFLLVLCAFLIFKKRYMTLLFGLLGGILYMIVDFGIFHLWLGSRSIENGNLFWVLLWMSMSYGLTNFVLIWIWLSKDEHCVEFTALIWIWWICCPMIAGSFDVGYMITIQRTTGAYHGAMAIFMLISYFALIFFNLRQSDKTKRFNIIWLFVLGILVQLGWEMGLLIGGIRSAKFDVYQKIMTLITNSLVETNLGLPAIYLIYLAITSRYDEHLKKIIPISFMDNLAKSNAKKYKQC